MKNRKNLLILLPVCVFIFSFIIVRYFNISYALYSDTAKDISITENTEYEWVTKNTYSWHLINDSFRRFSSINASGTKLIQTRKAINGSKRKAVVYCATEGVSLSQSKTRKRKPIGNVSVNGKKKLQAVMPYMYPYITLGDLKSTLKESTYGLGTTTYNKYSFGKLTAQEAVTAAQAAIWSIIEGETSLVYSYKGTISSFSEFSHCSDYYNGKVITSEEKKWLDSKNGKFEKYVCENSSYGAKNRINTLITWYITNGKSGLQKKLKKNSDPDYFKIKSTTFETDSLTMVIDTNVNSFDIIFTDQSGNTLLKKTNTNTKTYKIENLAQSVKKINVKLTSNEKKSNLYYYDASHGGQDFIGLEKGNSSFSEKAVVNRKIVNVGKIIIYKVGETDKNVEVSESTTVGFDANICGGAANKCLSNAKFELYYEDKDEPIKSIVTNYGDLNNTPVIIDNLPYGTYYLKETQPSLGYDLYNYGVGPVDSEGFIKVEINKNSTYNVIVNNNKTHICFEKIDATTGEHLSHAIFQIMDIDNSVLEEFETSDNNNLEKYCLDGQLQTGSYFIREVKAPEGYSLDTNKYHFTVGRGENDILTLEDTGKYVDISPINGVITFKNAKEVSISKSDATTGQCVSGAELVIRDSNGNVVKDENGKEIGRWISTCSDDSSYSYNVKKCDNGFEGYAGSDTEREVDDEEINTEEKYICTYDNDVEKSKDTYRVKLEPGTYTLTETMTEELRQKGYSSESETITFTVNANGSVSSNLDMKDAPVVACLYKVNKGNKQLLSGATFNLYKEDGKTLYKTFTSSDSANNNCLAYIPFGKYVIKEIKAPNGYKISTDEITIDIKDTKNRQYFYIENEIIAPKTDADNTKLLFIISTIFMVFGIGMVGLYGFKKQ